MFKKIFVLALCAMLLLTSAMAEATENYRKWTAPTPGDPASKGWTAPNAGDPLTLMGDFVLNLDGILYWIHTPMESGELSIITQEGETLDYGYYDGLKDKYLDVVFGDPIDYYEKPTCGGQVDAYDKLYDYDGLSVSTYPLGTEHDILKLIIVTCEGITTSRGIGIGSSFDDVVAAYGDNYSEMYDSVQYNVTGDKYNTKAPYITFYMTDGIVDEIDICYDPSTL